MKATKTAVPTPIKHRPPSYSTFLPFLLVLLTLTLSATKELVTQLQRKAALRAEIARTEAPLMEAGKQAAVITSVREDLEKLAETDPAAAGIVADFFPPSVKLIPGKEPKSQEADVTRKEN